MKFVEVHAEHDYKVEIGTNWRDFVLSGTEGRSQVAIIHSQNRLPAMHELPSVDAHVHYFPVPDGEAGKSAQVLLQLWDWLGAAGFTRSDLIVGIGGGTITDLAGFVAATWLRGIDWIAIPTTLAGAVDAAVGGKTGINSEYGKNLVGSFHSPKSVYIDLQWLNTLSDRDFAAGMAEVIKCGFIADPSIIERVKGLNIKEIRASSSLVESLVLSAVQVKASVVSTDFKDNFAREILNYGHTLGHAVERDSKYSLRHGEAVSIGMIYAAELSVLELGLDVKVVAEHREVLTRLGLPTTYPRASWPLLLSAMALDKKSRGRVLRFVGIKDIAQTQRIEDPTEAHLLAAYEKVAL
ncbi:unannotated protein [freshwater metagenome]|uniref:3-dehydroquinate synthase n=1 Tax=freshwater metagenome TaxID=449393 RepID=A0A6J7XPM7_9ZZZZ|nr:3-dehydroquinate synthase [Actinomycetota bacterium]